MTSTYLQDSRKRAKSRLKDSNLRQEWAVNSHGRNVKSLQRVRGFHVVPVEWASRHSSAMKSIYLIDLTADVCLPYLRTMCGEIACMQEISPKAWMARAWWTERTAFV